MYLEAATVLSREMKGVKRSVMMIQNEEIYFFVYHFYTRLLSWCDFGLETSGGLVCSLGLEKESSILVSASRLET